MREPTGKTYTIATLQDIYDLPNAEMISDCLATIGGGLIKAKVADETFVSELRKAGLNPPERIIEWPESIRWTDDGDNTSKLTFPELK